MAAIGIFLTITAGLFFYWLRCQFRFWYGVIEIAVALGVIYMTFVPQTDYLLLGVPPTSHFLFTKGAGILAGIYILVRGMDNMDQDLPPNWRRIWDKAFPKRGGSGGEVEMLDG
jgi:hypothetical protein